MTRVSIAGSMSIAERRRVPCSACRCAPRSGSSASCKASTSARGPSRRRMCGGGGVRQSTRARAGACPCDPGAEPLDMQQLSAEAERPANRVVPVDLSRREPQDAGDRPPGGSGPSRHGPGPAHGRARPSSRVSQSHLCNPYREDMIASREGLVITGPFLRSTNFVSYLLANRHI